MSQLSSLLEKHRQLEQRSAFKSHYDLQQPNCKTNETFNFKSQPNITNSQSVSQNYSNNCGNGKVYVNPNYEQKNLRIHINPRLNLKSSIHVNPKLIHNMNNNPNPVNFPDIGKDICQPPSKPDLKNKRLVHINPKLMNKLICDAPETNITNHSTPSIINVEHPETIPVAATNLDSECLGNSQINLNLKNVAPVSESAVETNSMEDIEIIEQKINKTYFNTKIKKVNSSNYIIHSKTKLVKKSTPKNKLNSSIIILSKRKLVRMKKNPAKPISPVKKSPKKLKIVKKCLLSKPTISPKALNFSEIQDDQRLKLNRIKSQMKGNKIQKSYVNHSTNLISIDGVFYKKSRNHLIRNSKTAAKIPDTVENVSDSYYIAANGKKLMKSNLRVFEITNPSKCLNTSICLTKNYKTNISNKVKQRSLQILRNKLSKNNKPCLLFQKFGYCANQIKGICPKVHDKNRVAICKNFLQGKCLLNDCPLSHNVIPEKMPTCKYFLEGCCNRDSCPYLHVKVSIKNPICTDFLQGYCTLGNQCKHRHIIACPEFEKNGNCSKGKFCHYPHKTHQNKEKKSVNINNKSISRTKLKKIETTEHIKRYYDENQLSSKDLNEKRENLLKQVRVIKHIHNNTGNNKNLTDSINELNDTVIDALSENVVQSETIISRRPPIGPLPSYIPIE